MNYLSNTTISWGNNRTQQHHVPPLSVIFSPPNSTLHRPSPILTLHSLPTLSLMVAWHHKLKLLDRAVTSATLSWIALNPWSPPSKATRSQRTTSHFASRVINCASPSVRAAAAMATAGWGWCLQQVSHPMGLWVWLLKTCRLINRMGIIRLWRPHRINRVAGWWLHHLIKMGWRMVNNKYSSSNSKCITRYLRWWCSN